MHQPTDWRPARVRALRTLSPTVREFELEPEGGVRPWTVGSHIQVRLRIAGRIDTRSYSLVGEPGQEAYRIAVKRVQASRGGSHAMKFTASATTRSPSRSAASPTRTVLRSASRSTT